MPVYSANYHGAPRKVYLSSIDARR
jgi:hypothetical protein